MAEKGEYNAHCAMYGYISLKTTSFAVRGKRVKTPPSEWVRVEDTHEPIVSYELFVKANTMFRQMEL